MASLPPRPQAQQQQQRRSSGNQRESAAGQHLGASADESFHHIHRASSSSSVDSQTVLLDHHSGTAQSQTLASPADQDTTASPHPYHQPPDDDTRKCWICFEDETEDTPESSRWISPCPCALTAHEACLLDWIADMERPSGSRATATKAEIRCPQCKSEIHLSRPRDQVVNAVGALEQIKSRLLLPTVLAGVGYGALLVFSHHGAHSIRMIFGAADAEAMLAPRLRPSPLEQAALKSFPNIAGPLLRNWRGLRMEAGLPLIPLSLIASRTTLADAILPVLPILFFATNPGSRDTLTSGYWPPSAALTLVTLPYLRGIYDEYLERVWAPHERRWIREVQPRQGEAAEAPRDAQADAQDANDIVQVELGFEVEVVEEVEVPDGGAADVAEQQAPELEAPPLDGEPQEQQREQQQQERAGAPPAPPPHRHDANIVISSARIADTVVGALLFPTICRIMGEVLRLGLPLSWTTPRIAAAGRWAQMLAPTSSPTGLLQTRWGRSIVGGCLFVVLKDAVRIYCRWRMAQAFRRRHVLNYDKKTGRVVE